MARLQTQPPHRRYAVWRQNNEWQAIPASALELARVVDFTNYVNQPEITTHIGFVEPVRSLEQQRVMVVDRTNSDRVYALFYLGDYEIPQETEGIGYLRFADRSFATFDETLVQQAMVAVKAYEQRETQRRAAERQYEEIREVVEEEWANALKEHEDRWTAERRDLNERFVRKLAQVRADLGLPDDED